MLDNTYSITPSLYLPLSASDFTHVLHFTVDAI